MIAPDTDSTNDGCLFCQIACGHSPASIVCQDDTIMAVIDLRQFHPGHTIVIPRRHIPDIRTVDARTAAALMFTLTRVAKAVSVVFPGDGLSIWHSAGEGANQEVPHLHFHVHPRTIGDNLLRVYPNAPPYPARKDLDRLASRIRHELSQSGPIQ
jgi:histidine triad (HIT) family protein